MKSNFGQKITQRRKLTVEKNKSGDESKIKNRVSQKIDILKIKSDLTDNYISEIKSNFRDQK